MPGHRPKKIFFRAHVLEICSIKVSFINLKISHDLYLGLVDRMDVHTCWGSQKLLFIVLIFVGGIVGFNATQMDPTVHTSEGHHYTYITRAQAREWMDDYLESHHIPLHPHSSWSLPVPPQSKNGEDLILFIGITTSEQNFALRHAARQTWLLPCIYSPVCAYRFFCDVTNTTLTLMEEQSKHQDIVLRQNCALMKQHPDGVNYGNSPPIYVQKHPWMPAAFEGDYPRRRAYKIDWKSCFSKWALKNDHMAQYHAWVEDDSFVCTEHLLYQMTLLAARSSESRREFRTGHPLYDGFDDSSTLMSRGVAMALAQKWPGPGLNCSAVLDLPLDQQRHANAQRHNYLSWGNAWTSRQCQMQRELSATLGKEVITPYLDCFHVKHGYTKWRNGPNGTVESPRSFLRHYPKDFFCPAESLIRHHDVITMILLSEPRSRHICERSLFIDKVKDPRDIRVLWGTADKTNFTDYSDVFTNDQGAGWELMFARRNLSTKYAVRVDRHVRLHTPV